MRHFLSLTDITPEEMFFLINKSIEVKKTPENFANNLFQKTLMMIFAKPSLRTRLSFETLMTQCNGHGIYYDISTSPMGKKESIADTAKTASRMVDVIMARLFDHSDIEELAANSSVPVINALTNFSHPCQILADLMTVQEKRGKLQGLKLSYFGDCNNNVTHSLMRGGAMAGMKVFAAAPDAEEHKPLASVVEETKKIAEKTGGEIVVTSSPEEAAKDADVLYTDSWMSYHIKDEEKDSRMQVFEKYRVTQELMKIAHKDAIFLHCLPAQRGVEVTSEVIDGPQSFVFDEAENRLHAQKALVLWLLGKL